MKQSFRICSKFKQRRWRKFTMWTNSEHVDSGNYAMRRYCHTVLRSACLQNDSSNGGTLTRHMIDIWSISGSPAQLSMRDMYLSMSGAQILPHGLTKKRVKKNTASLELWHITSMIVGGENLYRPLQTQYWTYRLIIKGPKSTEIAQ